MVRISQKVVITHLAIGKGCQVTHHFVAMKKVAGQHILTKCFKCKTFQVTTDLVHDFMNFNTLQMF